MSERVSKFRDQLQIAMSPKQGIRDASDPFVVEFVAVLRQTLDDMDKALVDADDEKLDRLLDHWAVHMAHQAYRDLASSVNTGVSHATSRLVMQAAAAAYNTVFEEVVSFQKYGLFEIRGVKTRP